MPNNECIRVYGDPVLRLKAKPVTEFNNRLKSLLEKMAKCMYQARGVGLAAPQVGVSVRAAVIDVGDGLITLVNPKITAAEGEEVDVEGCLSLPGLIGDVPRSARVTVQALDSEGKEKKISGDGLLARALQHELDHLDGILFIDRAQNIRPCENDHDEEG